MSRKSLFRYLVAPLLIVVHTASCALFRSAETSLSYLTVPPQQEAQLGAEFATEIEKEVEVINDPVAQAWLDRVMANLLEHSPQSDLTYTGRIITSDEVNAFAIPGGYFYINRGLMKLADNEAQVAAVIGHEINHVTARHGIRSLQRQLGIELMADLASSDPRTGAVVSAVKSAGGLVAMRSFSREDEREADRLGVQAMYGAGYDPREAYKFFEKMQEWQKAQGYDTGGQNFVGRIAATHPATDERIENIKKQIEEAQMELGPSLVTDTEEFRRVKARLGI